MYRLYIFKDEEYHTNTKKNWNCFILVNPVYGAVDIFQHKHCH